MVIGEPRSARWSPQVSAMVNYSSLDNINREIPIFISKGRRLFWNTCPVGVLNEERYKSGKQRNDQPVTEL